MSESNATRATGCIVALTAFVLSVPLRAYVLADLWAWFVVPLGVQAIGMWHAFGLSTLAWLLKPQWDNPEDESDGSTRRLVTISMRPVLAALVMWAMGWAARSWGMA